MPRLLGPILLLGILFAAASVRATTTDTDAVAALCDAAGARAAQTSGVPQAVLQAIALTETGRKLNGRHRPWPWTVNMEGVGKWFATREEAIAYVKEHHSRGARSYDVGCFQINYRWHGQAFTSIEQMFDPAANAAYAGRFLSELFAETGSWSRSAGAYHSRTPEYANRYRARFDRILTRLTGGAEPPAPPAGGEYEHRMAEVPAALPEQVIPAAVDPPEPWVPPPPSRFGSIAAVDHLPRGRSLLTAPRRGLY